MLKERGERMHRGFEWSTPWRGVGEAREATRVAAILGSHLRTLSDGH